MSFKRCWISLSLVLFLAAGVISLLTAENCLRAQARFCVHLSGKDILQLPSVAQPVKVFGKKSNTESNALPAPDIAFSAETNQGVATGLFISNAKSFAKDHHARGPPGSGVRA